MEQQINTSSQRQADDILGQPQDVDLIELDRDQLVTMLSSQPQLINNIPQETAEALLKKLNKYSTLVDYTPTKEFYVFSIVNWKVQYLKKFMMLSMIDFTQQMLKEYDDYALRWLSDKEQVEKNKQVIKQFFEFMFETHQESVKSSVHKPQSEETEESTETDRIGAPSQDVYERWQRYEEQNSKALKEKLFKYYHIKPNVEHSIQVFDSFDTQQKAEQFVKSHYSEISTDMYVGKAGKWVSLESSEDTIELTKFCDQDDSILDSMLSRWVEDSRMGQEMLDKRKETMKKQNDKENGEVDKESLKQYVETNSRLTKQELFGVGKDSGGLLQHADQYPIAFNDGSKDLSWQK